MPAHLFKRREASGEKESGKTAQEGRSRTLVKFIVVLGILAVVLIVTFLAAPIKSWAAFSGANGKIAFQSNRDGNYEIYVMNADGSDQTRLTNNVANDFNPAWSPDGTKIAFATDQDGNFEIYVMNADGSNQTRLTLNAARDDSPAWSPDGTRIAFIRASGPKSGDVYIMNSDGSDETKLTDYVPGSFPVAFNVAWSPDGAKIAFLVALSDFNQEIYIMNPDGSGLTALTNNGVLTYSVNWSPDGTKIAFSGGSPGSAAIYLMNPDGSDQTNLTNNRDSHAAWSPDGTKIVFLSDRDGNGEIYVMNTDGTGQTRLTFNSAQDVNPDWQPLYNFSGFFQPIDNNLLNVAKAGSAIPVKFSLGGNQGLGIMAAGYPISQKVDCVSSTIDAIEETVTAGSSSLSYDPASDQYIYVWKTDKSWAGACRTLVVKLIDGTFHYANFRFTK